MSPALALAALMPAALAAGPGGALASRAFASSASAIASMGERAFGITPGEGELWLVRCARWSMPTWPPCATR